MLTKKEATLLAKGLIAKEREANARGWGRRVPFFMRTAESALLPAWRAWDLYREAVRNLWKAPRIGALLVAWPFVILSMGAGLVRRPIRAYEVIALLVLLIVPFVVQTLRLRREFSRLVRAHLADRA